jgi:hypothetical protein
VRVSGRGRKVPWPAGDAARARPHVPTPLQPAPLRHHELRRKCPHLRRDARVGRAARRLHVAEPRHQRSDLALVGACTASVGFG